MFAVALAVELCIALLGSALKGISGHGAPYVLGFGTPREIGRLFLTTYLFPFEVASLLLMVAVIGAVVLARRRRGLEGSDDDFDPGLITARSLLTGTMAESTGIRGGFGTEPDIERATSTPERASSTPERATGTPDRATSTSDPGQGGW